MNISSKLNAHQELNRVRSSLRRDLLNGVISPDDYVAQLNDILHRVRSEKRRVVGNPHLIGLCEVLDEEENEIAFHLKVVSRHRNSVCYQGGDFDLYLSLQNLGGTLPQSSDWGTL